MREYKLIKKYPGLPINWREGMIVCQVNNCFYGPKHEPPYEYVRESISKVQIERYPEFWEEVKTAKKQYEIVAEEYILMNSKSLSINEVINLFPLVHLDNLNLLEKRLKEYVKINNKV